MVILVAEDLDDGRQMLRLLLETYGHEVLEAENGLEAVRLAIARRPDLVLMDLNMPVMDGIQAVRYLREQASTHDVPIIALTAHSGDGGWQEQAMEAGCNEYFSKPVDFDALSMVIKRWALKPNTGSSCAGSGV